MNEPRPAPKLTHLPGLDGLRGLAVIGVLAFHGGFSAFKGGFLGVSTFFTLSGFLITGLLLREFATHGTISLRTFWLRRFRRLMPAALAGLLLACLYGVLYGSPEQLARLRVDVLAGLAYVANWRFVLAHKRYADLFAAPSPLQHYWSLAIEEQFYVVYPLLVAVALRVGGRRALTAVLVALAGVSVALSFALSSDFDRVYYGTDTRAFELLAGGLFSIWWTSASPRSPSLLPRPLRDLIGGIGLALSLGAWATVGQTSVHLPRGGFVLQALATCAVLVALTTNGAVARVLSWGPIRAVGLISYGLYVYHWPVFLALDSARTDLGRGALFVLRLAVTASLALVSYVLIEQPIRSGRVLHGFTLRVATPIAVLTVLVAAMVVSWDPPASSVAYANASIDEFKPRVIDLAQTPTTEPHETSSTTVSLAASPAVPAPRTVMIIGDSGMTDLEPALAAAYSAMGTHRLILDARPGFGLTSLAGSQWRRSWSDLVETNRPEVIVSMFGKWDLPWLRSNGDEAYAALVDEAVTILTAHGARVHWLGMLPSSADPDRPANRIFERVAARHPDTVVYDDFETVLRTGEVATSTRTPMPVYGRIRTLDGLRLLLRKPDAWHLCQEGAHLLAAAVAAREADLLWAPAAPETWIQGTWRHDNAYQDPVDGCDPRAAGADK